MRSASSYGPETARATLSAFLHSAGAGFQCRLPAARRAQARAEPPTRPEYSRRENCIWQSRIGDARTFRAPDGMQDHHAVVGEQRCAFLEEGIVVTNADMFEHANRDDAIKRPLQVTIVLQQKTGAIVQIFLSRALVCDCMLLLRQRDAGDIGAAKLREVKAKPAPATANVQDTLFLRSALAWLQGDVSSRVAHRRAMCPAFRNSRSCIACRHPKRANRDDRRGHSDGRRCGAPACGD